MPKKVDYRLATKAVGLAVASVAAPLVVQALTGWHQQQQTIRGRVTPISQPRRSYWYQGRCPSCGHHVNGRTEDPVALFKQVCNKCAEKPLYHMAMENHFKCAECNRLRDVPEDLIMNFDCMDCENYDKFVLKEPVESVIVYDGEHFARVASDIEVGDDETKVFFYELVGH